MARITKRFTRTLCVVLAIAGVGVLGLPASASASATAAPSGAVRAGTVRAAGTMRPDSSGPTAVLEHYQWLTGSPTSGMPMVCISKSIYLKDDIYDFIVFLYDRTSATQPYIPAGTYNWLVCIYPEDTSYFTGYEVIASVVSTSFYATVAGEFQPASGYYWWGSWLTPH